MTNTNQFRITALPVRLLTLVAVCAFLFGCTGLGSDLVRSGRVIVEPAAHGSVRVVGITVVAEDSKVLVSGTVALQPRLAPHEHLDLELVSESGELLAVEQAKLRKRGGGPVRSRRASFGAELALSVPLPSKCVLRVSYHGVGHDSDE